MSRQTFRFKLLSVLILSSMVGLTVTPALSRTVHASTGKQTADGDDAVRSTVAELKDAVVNADAHKMASLWIEGGRYTDEYGNMYQGRENLEKAFADMMKESGKQPVQLSVQSIQYPAPGVAIVDGTVSVEQSGTKPKPMTRYSLTMVRRAAHWSIASGAETMIADSTATNVATPANPLQQLDWLVGDWSAERNGTRVKMNAIWLPNKNFINCRYDIDEPGKPTQVEVQIIGWDPRSNQPISWNFDSNGGFGRGYWLNRNNQWLVDSSNVERNGSISSSTNIISSTDPNSFLWQTTDRRVDGQQLGDAPPMKVTRVASK